MITFIAPGDNVIDRITTQKLQIESHLHSAFCAKDGEKSILRLEIIYNMSISTLMKNLNEII